MKKEKQGVKTTKWRTAKPPQLLEIEQNEKKLQNSSTVSAG